MLYVSSSRPIIFAATSKRRIIDSYGLLVSLAGASFFFSLAMVIMACVLGRAKVEESAQRRPSTTLRTGVDAKKGANGPSLRLCVFACWPLVSFDKENDMIPGLPHIINVVFILLTMATIGIFYKAANRSRT